MTALASLVPFQSAPGGFALGDFWSLTQQAGPLRWPIFFILGVGLVQVFAKLHELMRDRRVSKALSSIDLTTATLPQISTYVAQQEESMLSSLQSTMINVFQTRSSEGMLHDEISNFVSFQKDQFGTFRRRMEFLSDTAGALGLMGTVWGMFTVFFQGTSEQDVILRGMGIALITTLLGLVVSIILNFSATELSTFFGKRLEQVSRKSDELRFRLLELAAERNGVADRAVAVPAIAEPAASDAPVSVSPASDNHREARPVPNGGDFSAPTWRYLEIGSGLHEARAGEALRDLGLLVKDADGKPSFGIPVVITIAGVGGSLDGGVRALRVNSDEVGRVGFGCTVPETVGPFSLDVAIAEQAGPATRVEVAVRPGAAHQLRQEGNNQAAIAGMRLPVPMAVRVLDRFGNSVAGLSVDFHVKKGGGMLGSGNGDHRVSTDATGRASTAFVVSSEAGQNTVEAKVAGMSKSVEFVAFGTQV